MPRNRRTAVNAPTHVIIQFYITNINEIIMPLWGPLSEENIEQDYNAVLDIIDKQELETPKEPIILEDYYEPSRMIVEGEKQVEDLTSSEVGQAIRFFELGYYLRNLSSVNIIDFEGSHIKGSIENLYKSDLLDKPLDFIHELRTASAYIDDGHDIAFIDENSSEQKVPEFRVLSTDPIMDVECKRPNPNRTNRSSVNTASRLAGIIQDVSEKFDNNRQNIIHIEIPRQIRLSPKQNERLRNEVAGEIVQRDDILNGVFLQQIGRKQDNGDPISIVGVKGPRGDTTILDYSSDFIPHYFDQPDEFKILGIDVQNAVSVHQIYDDAIAVGSGSEHIRHAISVDSNFTLQCLIDPSILFQDRQAHFVSNMGDRILSFGGRGPNGKLKLWDINRGYYRINLPVKLNNLTMCHIIVRLGSDGLFIHINPVYPDSEIEKIERSAKSPDCEF